MVSYKKPIAMILSLILMVSIVLNGLPLGSIISAKAAPTPFTAQHIDVDFDKYVIDNTDNMIRNVGGWTISGDNTSGWVVGTTTNQNELSNIESFYKKQESGNWYLNFDNRVVLNSLYPTELATATSNVYGYQKYSGRSHRCSFIVNAAGAFTSANELTLNKDATYRVKFRYRNVGADTLKISFKTTTATKNANNTGTKADIYLENGDTKNNTGSTAALNATDWTDYEVVIKPEADGYLLLILSDIATDKQASIDLDDIQVDRIDTATVKLYENGEELSGSDMEITYAPKAAYNTHLFSAASGDFAGGVLNAETGSYEDIQTAFAVSKVTSKGVSDEADYLGLYESIDGITPLESIPAAAGATYYAKYSTGGTAFTPQHADVDFENYNVDGTTNMVTNVAGWNLTDNGNGGWKTEWVNKSDGNAYQSWSVKGETGSKYLNFNSALQLDKNYPSTITSNKDDLGKNFDELAEGQKVTAYLGYSGKAHRASFAVNVSGTYTYNKDKEIYLQKGGKYRVILDYRLNDGATATGLCFDAFTGSGKNTNANHTPSTITSSSVGIQGGNTTTNALKSTTWETATFEFTANVDGFLMIRISAGNNTYYNYDFDNIQVDRVATVTIKDKNDGTIGTVTGAPACEYNQYLFSSAEPVNFEAEAIPSGASAVSSATTATGWDYKNSNFNKTLTVKSSGAVTYAGLYTSINMKDEDLADAPKFQSNNDAVYYKQSEDTTGQLSFLDFEGAVPSRGDVFVGNADDNTHADYDNLQLKQHNNVYTIAHTAKWAVSSDQAYTGKSSIAWQGTVNDEWNKGMYVGGGTGFNYGKSYELSFYIKKGADNDAQNPVSVLQVVLTGASPLSGSGGNEKSATKTVIITESWEKVTLKYTPAGNAVTANNDYHSSGTSTEITDSVGPLSPILMFENIEGTKKGVPCVVYVDTLTIKEIDNTKVTFDYCDDATKEYAYGYEGEEIALITPKRSGYKFEGWFKEKGYTNKVEAPYKAPADDVTLYAKWQKLEEGFWSGDTKKPDGEGTENKPYQISDAEELAWVVNEIVTGTTGSNSTEGSYYELTNDIIVNDYTKANWKEKSMQWYTATNTFYDFKGTLDGKGYTIHGLYVNKVENEDANNQGTYTLAGLFPAIGDGAVIKNLGLDNSYICANAAGGFAGAVKNSDKYEKPSFIGCYVGKGVTVESKNENINGNQNFLGAGGFVGLSTQALEFRYCYSKATAIAEAHARINNKDGSGRNVFVEDTLAGTFVGFGKTNDKVEFRSCYSAPANPEIRMLGASDTGSPESQNSYATINIYKHNNGEIITYIQQVSDLNMIGNSAKEFMPNLDYKKVYKIVDGDTPILRVFDVNDAYYGYDLESHNDPFERDVIEGTPGKVWSGGIASKFAGGDGSVETPYEIATAEQLFYFIDIILESSWGSNSPTDSKYTTIGKHYKITHDIYLNDVSKKNWYEGKKLNEWVYANKHSQCLQGTLDGDGHVVYGLYFNVDVNTRIGLIPSIGQYGVIKNLALASSYIVNEGNTAAGICGMTESRGNARQLARFESCAVAEDVTVISGTSSGGILGFCAQAAYFENCYSLASLSGEFRRLGGITAYSPLQENTSFYLDEDNNPTDKAIKSIMINCYVADKDKRFLTGSLGYDNMVDATNCYTLSSAGEYSTIISLSRMTGDKAKANMLGFDFENVWTTVEKSTPALKIFADRKDLDISKLVRFKGPVTISFETYGGSNVKPIVGEPGEKIKLPTPTRDADVFGGWFVYPYETWDVPFTIDFIPDDDITLYAKWTTKSLRQGFESYYYIAEDETGMEADYLHYTSAFGTYDVNNVHSGAKSLWRRGEIDEYKNVSLCDENTIKLIPGAQYQLSMWIKLVDTPSAEDAIYLAWLQAADWATEELATEKLCDLSKLKVGEWQEVKFTFVAYGEYLGLRTPGVSMFIDDVNAIYTGNTGLKTKAVITPLRTETTVLEDYYYDEMTDGESGTTIRRIKKMYRRKLDNGGLDWWVYAVIGVSAAAVIAGAAVAIILIRKKKKLAK